VTRALGSNLDGELHRPVSAPSPIEAHAIMASQGLGEEDMGRAFSLIGTTLAKHKLQSYTSITLSDLQFATGLRQKTRSLTFFDSVHAAISTRENIPILSSDDIYRDLGVKWVDIRKLAP